MLLMSIKKYLNYKNIGKIYSIEMYYGNGTAKLWSNSDWRKKDKKGVIIDLAPHLLDIYLYLFGKMPIKNNFLLKSKNENTVFDQDEHPRSGITIEKLERLKPVFKKNGTVTAGNSSGINDGAAALLITNLNEAEKKVSESTSLYEHTRLVNDLCDYQDKLKLISNLWIIAFADNQLDKYEEYLIRKISDLLHVSHSDFIREKMKIKTAL